MALAALTAGCTKKEEKEKRPDTGLWHEFHGSADFGEQQSEDMLAQIHKLQTLGYVDGIKPAESVETSVTHVDPELVDPSLRLYTTGARAEARLIDVAGRELHAWFRSATDVWPESEGGLPFDEGIDDNPKSIWQRVYLLPGGELLAIFENLGLVKLDRLSNVIWKYTGAVHHDLDVTPDGRIHVITSELKMIPRSSESEPTVENLIVTLSPEGEVLSKISIFDALADSPFTEALKTMHEGGDNFHTNSIQVLLDVPEAVEGVDGFEPGAMLVSIRQLHLIGLIDPKSGLFTWVKRGAWKRQHHPTLLESGKILLFDNYGFPSPYGRSRVLEFDPAADEVVWEYAGNEQNHFNSATQGNVDRLPNGNTLINESNNGRIFEITREGEIVWEFINPDRAGSNGEFIAAIKAVDFVEREYVDAWLGEDPGGPATTGNEDPASVETGNNDAAAGDEATTGTVETAPAG